MSILTDRIIREVHLFLLHSLDCADKSSVAEMAEKPLYRVTCGDIGTKPEEVEKVCLHDLNRGGNLQRINPTAVPGDCPVARKDLGMR